MAIDISVGTELDIALGEPATYDEAGFEAITSYDEVGEVGAIPEFGGEAQVAEWTNLKTGEVNKRPGSINYGSFTIPIAQQFGDAGQDAAQSAFDGTNSREVHSFRLVKVGRGAIYFTGIVTGYKYNLGDSNQITQAAIMIELTAKPLAVEEV